jgi:anti-sigma B factor antagonist
MEGIQVSESRIGARLDIAMLTVKGYVDTMTCSILLNRITEHLNNGTLQIIIDMAQVNYVSSAGWGVFVGEIKGIREQGGDLKIVQMTPEVYDVFEMLEFNKILSYYDSVEEAMNDFDLSLGLDITKSMKRAAAPQVAAKEKQAPVVSAQRLAPRPASGDKSEYVYKKSTVDEKVIPLTEKIKLVIVDDPRRGAFKIKKVLMTERFGYTKVSVLRIYRTLKKLNLETHDKRYRFYRSR